MKKNRNGKSANGRMGEKACAGKRPREESTVLWAYWSRKFDRSHSQFHPERVAHTDTPTRSRGPFAMSPIRSLAPSLP
jgi:hypothetical protein